MRIQVLALNGDPVMGFSSAPKMFGATITESKPKKCG
jgi:hypothetical protein